MDRFMARPTDDKRFASSGYPVLDPLRLLFSPRLLELSEFADLVDCYFCLRCAACTRVSEHSLAHFAPLRPHALGLPLNKKRVVLVTTQPPYLPLRTKAPRS